MKVNVLWGLWSLLLPQMCLAVAFSGEALYCPTHSAYIKTGMTQDEVVAACGKPTNTDNANVPVMQRVPMTQLTYQSISTVNTVQGHVDLYNMWSLPVAGNSTIPGGIEFDVINDRISAIRVNGGDTNVQSLCGGVYIQVGQPVSVAYQNCGNPTMVNQTFVTQQVPSNDDPVVWVYQFDKYQAPISLTFIKGKLQSIHQ